jgi:hypothetical protein
MKHRNKRIGLNSDLFTHLSLYCTEWFKADCNKISKMSKMGQRGKWRKGDNTCRVQQRFASEALNHEVPNFPSLLGHTHSEVGWPSSHFY